MKRRVVPVFGRRKQWATILISIGFFIIYVIFYATIEEKIDEEEGDYMKSGSSGASFFNVTEVQLFPPGIPPLFIHTIPDFSVKIEGPGENGQGVSLEGPDEKREAEVQMKKWFMNVLAR